MRGRALRLSPITVGVAALLVLARFFAFDAGFTGGVRVAVHGTFRLPLLTAGPGGGGFAKMVFFGPSGEALDTGRGYVPFDMSLLGVFPSQ